MKKLRNHHRSASLRQRARFLLGLVASLMLSACGTTTWVVRPDYQGPAVIVEEEGNVSSWRWRKGAAHTRIRSIDGIEGSGRYLVTPGLHTFDVELRQVDRRYEGKLAMHVPEGNLKLAARLIGREFEVQLRSPAGTKVASARVAAKRAIDFPAGFGVGLLLFNGLAGCF